MKKLLTLLYLTLSLLVYSQNEQLAQNYFDKGEFEKALISYEELLKAQPNNFNFFQKSIECYQQLQQFEKADKTLQDRFNKYKQSNLLVELGFNYQLQKKQSEAIKFYNQAIEKIKKNPTEAYNIGYLFDKKGLTDYAILAYETASTLDPKLKFDYQIALLYGQKGDTSTMIDKLLNESFNNPQSMIIIQNQLSRYMTEDATSSFNDALRKALLVRIQKNQDIFWNEYLSWFYVQQKEYGKAFIQEKAIYKRDPESFYNIINLGQLAIDDKEEEAAKEILGFVLENTKDLDLKIQSHSYLMQLKIDKAQPKDYAIINNELDALIKEFGVTPFSLSLLKLKAHFSVFVLKDVETGKTILKNILEMSLNREQTAEIKMELADVFLFEEKFNQALLYYSQIENDSNNSPIGQEASLKTAKTSYYKGDFKWAEHQLKVLKSATTQLIANDALDLYLLISDNTIEDSTQVALKKFSKADFLIFKDKTDDALLAFQKILKEHKGEEIEPITLLRVGKILEKKTDYNQALSNYLQIIENHKECIYIDEALFFAAEIYNQQGNFEKAKSLYEQIILNKADSIYFVEAQKKYRKIRGDKDI